MADQQNKHVKAIRIAVGIITGSAYARISPQLLGAADELERLQNEMCEHCKCRLNHEPGCQCCNDE